MRFEDFFHDTFEYPDPTEHDLSKAGWRFDYISSTFLNGWINYVKPVSAFVMSRYAEDFSTVKAKLAEWESKPPYHTKLHDLGDDVHILARDKGGKFWCFEYDCDTSDCSVGVLDVGDAAEADVIEAFAVHVRNRAEHCARGYEHATGEALPIASTLLRGWVSF